MNIHFWKYHGTGNDFIMIDNRKDLIRLSAQQIVFMCNRHSGIGADGLILLTESSGYDFGMTYFNSDGGEGSMCGNGGRCITAFAAELGIIKNKAAFKATDGIHHGEILHRSQSENVVRVSLKDVEKVEVFNDGYFIDTGSPHFVMFVDDIETVDVIGEGKRLRHDQRFQPAGTNVNFVQIRKDHFFVKTYERGVEDHTLSCGTGNTASAIAASVKQNDIRSGYAIESPGGKVIVKYDRNEDKFFNVRLQGPVKIVFEGSINI